MMLSDVCLSVCLSRTSGLRRTERPRKTKIGTEVGHVIRNSDTTFKVKRSKVKVTGGGGISWRPPAQLVMLFVSLLPFMLVNEDHRIVFAVRKMRSCTFGSKN